jgi:hypothetical protein
MPTPANSAEFLGFSMQLAHAHALLPSVVDSLLLSASEQQLSLQKNENNGEEVVRNFALVM